MIILPANRRPAQVSAAGKRRAQPVKISETQEHRAIVAYLKRVGLGGHAYWWHNRNERHGDYQRMDAARMGVRSGLPDFGFVDGGQSGWCELKPRGWKARTARTGTYTAHELRQLDVHAALKRAGAWVEIVETLDEMLAVLAHHGVPLRTESRVSEAIRRGFAAAEAGA